MYREQVILWINLIVLFSIPQWNDESISDDHKSSRTNIDTYTAECSQCSSTIPLKIIWIYIHRSDSFMPCYCCSVTETERTQNYDLKVLGLFTDVTNYPIQLAKITDLLMNSKLIIVLGVISKSGSSGFIFVWSRVCTNNYRLLWAEKLLFNKIINNPLILKLPKGFLKEIF